LFFWKSARFSWSEDRTQPEEDARIKKKKGLEREKGGRGPGNVREVQETIKKKEGEEVGTKRIGSAKVVSTRNEERP